MSDQDELPLFRPKISGRSRKEQVHIPGSLSKKVSGSARGGYVKRGSKPAYVRQASGNSRKVIVKARVVKMNDYGKKAARLHELYLQRDHVGKDGSEGKFYGPEVKAADAGVAAVAQGEPHQFRFIISPADAHELELTDFTRDLMRQMEKDLGREVEWKAVNHYNTDNPHVHVVVRGIDRYGQELRIDPDYISNGLRHRAQEIVTRELGPQSRWAEEQALAKEIGKDRFTSLDARLAHLEKQGRIDVGDYPESGTQRMTQGGLVSRLQVLEKLELAEKTGSREWSMKNGWKESLKEMGQRQDVFREMHREVGGDPSRYRIYDRKAHGDHIEGRIAAKGLADELGDRYFLIVETPQGTSFYVPADKSVDPEAYRKGDIVSVRAEQESWLKPTDRIIAEKAGANGGRFDLEHQIRGIEGDMVAVGKGRVGKEALAEAVEKRLQRLRRFRLAELLQDGSWKVDPALIEKLQQKDRTHPVSKVEVHKESGLTMKEQEGYRGRTWLDRFTASDELPNAGKFGFGKELNGSIQRRVAMLREMGIDPMDPARGKALDSIERRDLAHRISKTTGATPIELSQGGKISGVISDAGTLPSGRRYARVLDVNSKEFSLVPWRQEFGGLVGKSVELFREPSAGRYLVRQVERGLGR
jgi:type IV secretory pathway VirD2 relaxase